MFYTATYVEPLQVQGGPVERQYKSSINTQYVFTHSIQLAEEELTDTPFFSVVTDTLLPLPPGPPEGFDQRRVVALDQVLKDEKLQEGLRSHPQRA